MGLSVMRDIVLIKNYNIHLIVPCNKIEYHNQKVGVLESIFNKITLYLYIQEYIVYIVIKYGSVHVKIDKND